MEQDTMAGQLIKRRRTSPRLSGLRRPSVPLPAGVCHARQSIVANVVLTVPLLFLLSGRGIVLFAFCRQHSEELKNLRDPDAILPYFAVQHLPGAIAALVVASIFAACMTVM